MSNTINILNSKLNRHEYDLYETPKIAVEKLLLKEKFNKNIFEPCAGKLAITNVLKKHNFNVVSYDIIDYTGNIDKIQDATKIKKLPFKTIITNPPFKLKYEIISNLLNLNFLKIALILPIQFLETEKRTVLFKHLKKIYVFRKRLKFVSNNVEKNGVTYCWFIWDKKYNDLPKIDWI